MHGNTWKRKYIELERAKDFDHPKSTPDVMRRTRQGARGGKLPSGYYRRNALREAWKLRYSGQMQHVLP